MNGYEHYRQAETLLASSSNSERGTPQDLSVLAEAQVHATLALAEATGAVRDAMLASAPGRGDYQ